MFGFIFQRNSPNTLGNRWLSVIKFDPHSISVHPYKVMRELRSFGIETRPSWKPMHLQPLCRDFEFIPHSNTQVVSSDIFFTGLSASHSESVSGSRSLLIKELFAPFSNSLLTRYGSKSLYLPIGA